VQNPYKKIVVAQLVKIFLSPQLDPVVNPQISDYILIFYFYAVSFKSLPVVTCLLIFWFSNSYSFAYFDG